MSLHQNRRVEEVTQKRQQINDVINDLVSIHERIGFVVDC